MRFPVAASIALAALICPAACSGDSGAIDREVLPPAVRTIESSQGEYRLVLESPARQPARAILIAVGDPDRILWEKQLPHQQGPRVGLVGSQGSVVLLDEWINVFTDHAITVYDNSGVPRTTASTDDVATLLGVSRAELAAGAAFGPWMRGRPYLSGGAVVVPMGDSQVRISLPDGTLEALRP